MKKIIFVFFIFVFFISPACAEKIPVRLENTSLISTRKDEVQLGDLLPFRVVNDVYVKNKLYISQGTKAIGCVDFVQENGWAGSGAEIRFKKFMTKDVEDKLVTIEYPIILDGNAERFATTVNYSAVQAPVYFSFLGSLFNVCMFIRGHELKIEPQKANFSVFIER